MLTLLALAPVLAPALPPQDGFTALPLPAVSRRAPAQPAPLALDDGRHIRLAERPPRELLSEPAVDPGLALQLLEEEGRRRGAALRLRGGIGVILAQGPSADVELLRPALASLDALDDALRIELEVTLTPAGADARTELRSVRSGDTAVFGERVQRSFLGGWEVDVATESGVADPVLGTVHTGEVVHLVPTRLSSGSAVHVRGLLDLAQGAELAEFDPDTPDLGIVQQPRVRFAQVAFSGVVASGEPLRLALSGLPLDPPDWTVTITARAQADPRPDPARGWHVLDLAALAEPRGALPAHGPGFGLQHEDSSPTPFDPGLGALSPAMLATMLDGAVQLPRPPLWTGRLLFVPSEDPAGTDTALALVDALSAPRHATTVLNLRHGELALSFPTAAGAVARALVGEERVLLVDYDTELAPHTWMGEPRIARAFDGLSFEGACDGRTLQGAVWIARTLDEGALAEKEAGLGRMQWVQRALRGDVVRRSVPLENALLLPATAAQASLELDAKSR